MTSIHVDPEGSLTDVMGIAVGHYQRIGRGWRTGTTAVVVSGGATAGVDVRGGGPGTRETDLLRPENLIEKVHAICLTGGSAYGLAAASGVMHFLEVKGVGFPVGTEPDAIVPIVPAAVIFDLGRGGVFTNRPNDEFGRRAAAAARRKPETNGAVGAGTGAVAGGLQGGVGSASALVPSGIVVAALAVVNAAGTLVDHSTGLPWEAGAHRVRRPEPSERQALSMIWPPQGPDAPLNTTIGVVATSARLTKAECSRLASVGHDGMARAIRPVHSMFDGDTVFSLATGTDELASSAETAGLRAEGSRASALNVIFDAAALCFAAACTQAILSARSIGGPLAYADLCPSAFRPSSRARPA